MSARQPSSPLQRSQYGGLGYPSALVRASPGSETQGRGHPGGARVSSKQPGQSVHGGMNGPSPHAQLLTNSGHLRGGVLPLR